MKQKILTTMLLLVIVSSAFAQQDAASTNPPLTADSFAAKISRQLKPQIVDVRSPEEFIINHINGAVNVNLKVANYLDGFKDFDKTKPVFLYSIQNYRSGILAKELREKGYAEVYELKSGIPNWIGSGYPYYSSVKNVVSINEYKKIIADNKLVLVDIGTKYCGSCVRVKQIVDSLKTESNNSFETVQIELYNNPQLAADLKEIKAVPTVLLYKEGKLVWKKTGGIFTKEQLSAEIAKVK
jgi:rhodanese-related sulfurtransferase/glutaredoxin-related protein